MSTNQQHKNEEEVDLGSLFVIIGKGFKNFFNFIGNIFKGIFHAIIIVLLFIKTNIIPIVISGLIGGSLGAFLELKSSDLYGSEMLVKPNFKSSKLLYNNINFYNDLVKQKDTASLQKTFKISKESAGSIKKFSIEPIISEFDIINGYDDFVTNVDTTTVKSYEFKDFKNSFTDFDYKFHRINVIAEKADIFAKLENTVISSIENNTYFERLKRLTFKNLNTTDTLIKRSIAQIDSLQKALTISTIKSAQKNTTGTNIDLGSQNSRPKEVELIETNRRLIEDLQQVVKDRSEKNVVINVVSNFSTVGYKINGVTKNYIFLLGISTIFITVLFLLLKKLNLYLNNYKK